MRFARSARIARPVACIAGSISALAAIGLPTVRAQVATAKAVTLTPPSPRREFRGVWIATVGNDDWPSRPDLTTDQQKAELIALLDRAQALHLNAIILQVRPACDALYASPIEPWSPFLTGAMGKAPDPVYDPLAFAVTEAHRRGMELHAWFNPFRVLQSGEASRYPASANHVSRAHPEWVRSYGSQLWLDPGVKAARDYSLSVIADVVRRYDVDGVHIDDYFYPYKVNDAQGKPVDFPDAMSYAAYRAGGGNLELSDWRRSNTDDFVQRMYTSVKAIKPWVKVGISPFGIWRPGYPAQTTGMDAFEEIYADSRRWWHEGWVDYLTPQLYWRIEQPGHSYPTLLNWWINENTKGRNLWPGLYTSLAQTPSGKWAPEDIEYQIKTTRGFPGASGEVHFSASFLLTSDLATPGGLTQRLFNKVYGDLALVPPSPWLEASGVTPLPAPTGLVVGPQTVGDVSGQRVSWTATLAAGHSVSRWLVQWHAAAGGWTQSVVWGDASSLLIPSTAALDEVTVTPIDAAGVSGMQAILAIPATPPVVPALPVVVPTAPTAPTP